MLVHLLFDGLNLHRNNITILTQDQMNYTDIYIPWSDILNYISKIDDFTEQKRAVAKAKA